MVSCFHIKLWKQVRAQEATWKGAGSSFWSRQLHFPADPARCSASGQKADRKRLPSPGDTNQTEDFPFLRTLLVVWNRVKQLAWKPRGTFWDPKLRNRRKTSKWLDLKAWGDSHRRRRGWASQSLTYKKSQAGVQWTLIMPLSFCFLNNVFIKHSMFLVT